MTSFHAEAIGRCQSHSGPLQSHPPQPLEHFRVISACHVYKWVVFPAAAAPLRHHGQHSWDKHTLGPPRWFRQRRVRTRAVSQHSTRVWETLGSILYGRRHGNNDVHRRDIDFNRLGEIIKRHLRFHYGSGTVNPNFNED